MMAFERKDFSGAAFKNRKKEQPNHADLNGDCMVAGVEYWVNAWKKVDKNGDTFISLSFKPKNGSAKKVESNAPLSQTLDDDIPF